MPEVNGVAFVRAVRRIGVDCAILMLTAYREDEEITVAHKRGLFHGVVSKPFSAEHLNTCVAAAIAKREQESRGDGKA